uniref:Estradiol 17-beta-dehydrogenase 12 n=1 Tax=Aceria tosichella TaxID=561515 RepID=A0A6G1S9V7_9ACAR
MDAVIYLSGYAIVFYFVLSIVYRLFRGLWNLKLGSLLGFSEKFKPKDNSWAVITGATDGIGLAYAHEFCKRGYNLLLISRNPSKLNDVKQEIDSKSNKKGKEIKVYAADFSKSDIYPGIEKEVTRLPRVDVLVNNVGMSYPNPEYFASPHLSEINEQIINVNSVSCAKMCSIVLPMMEQQKHGVILNVSSFSALDPCPLLALYAASKAFVDVFSRSIGYEYAKKGITVQSVLPGFVATKMSKIRKAYWMAPTPENYVKSQLKTVGLDDQTTGYWSHELQYYFTQHVFPIIYGRSLTSNIAFNQMKLLRHKALKKQQQQAADAARS